MARETEQIGTSERLRRSRRAVTVAILAVAIAACGAPATPPSAPAASPGPAASVAPSTAPVGSPTAAGSPGADRDASIRGSRVCIENATAAAISVQAATQLDRGRTPPEAAWTSLGAGQTWCTAGYNECTAEDLNGGDPYTRDTCGYVRVPDGGPTFWFFAVNPWDASPRLGITVDAQTFFNEAFKEGGSHSITANGITIAGKRGLDSDAYKEFTIKVSG